MTTAAPIPVSTTTTSAASGPTIGSKTGASATNGAVTGISLFSQLIASAAVANASAKALDKANIQSALQQQGGNGLTTTMLVLPQSLANLSEDELAALLANSSTVESDALNSQTLLSLTTGTPAAEALASFLKEKGATVLTLPADGTTSLTTGVNPSGADAQQILLVATNLSPSDLQQLKDALKSLSASTGEISSQPAADTSATTTDAESMTAAALAGGMILVMLVPPQNQTIENVSSGLDLANADLLGPSSAGFSLYRSGFDDTALTLASANQNMGQVNLPPKNDKYISLFSDLTAVSDSTLPFASEEAGFQGSLATLNADSTDANVSLQPSLPKDSSLGKLSSFPTDFSLGQGFALVGSGDNSLLLPNQNPLATSSPTLINPMTQGTLMAGSSHPTAQSVAALIEKSVSGSEKSKQELSVQLDPPELGRMQIQLSYEKGEALKVHLVAEKQDTLTLLQRDSHVLKSALDQAGIQTDSSSLTFDLASGDQSFNQLLGGSQDQQQSKGETRHFSLDNGSINGLNDYMPPIETSLDFVPDSLSGTVRYSLLV